MQRTQAKALQKRTLPKSVCQQTGVWMARPTPFLLCKTVILICVLLYIYINNRPPWILLCFNMLNYIQRYISSCSGLQYSHLKNLKSCTNIDVWRCHLNIGNYFLLYRFYNNDNYNVYKRLRYL